MKQINVSVTAKPEDIAGLLCSGFESGVGYWCRIVDYKEPEKRVPVLDASASSFGEKPVVYPHCDYPVSGGAVICRIDDGETEETDDEYKPLVLDGAAVQRGLDIMATRYARHFADFVSGNYDATTGDVFIQCCLLGEIVYG